MARIFYDCEVFAHDYIFVLYHEDCDTFKVTNNEPPVIPDDSVLIGFNNHNYDDVILDYALKGSSPEMIKLISDKIVSGVRFPKSKRNTEDAMMGLIIGLKEYQCNKGYNIHETSVSFDIERALTAAELESTIEYCKNDVKITREVYLDRLDGFHNPRKMLLEKLPPHQQIRLAKSGTNGITEELIIGKNSKPTTRSELDLLPQTEVVLNKFPELRAYFNSLIGAKRKVSKKVKLNGYDFIFGGGGLHQAVPSRTFDNVKLLDVTSLYPNLMINMKALDNLTSNYKAIVDERIAVKHTNKPLQLALKLAINSLYGILNNEYFKLYNPILQLSVCVNGQVCLFDLALRLMDAGYQIVQSNTDGLAFLGDNFDEIWAAWEHDWDLSLELETYSKLIQADVNNYIGITPTGKEKLKGRLMGKIAYDKFYASNSLGVIGLAVHDYLVDGTPVADTINSEFSKGNYIGFMMTVKAGSTFAGIKDCTTGEAFEQKINRAFAVKDGITIRKYKWDGGEYKLANIPDSVAIFNGDLSDCKLELDLDYYIELAEKEIKVWQK
jgi:hypothetical protein